MKKITAGLVLVLTVSVLAAGCKNNNPTPTASPALTPQVQVTTTAAVTAGPTATPAPTAITPSPAPTLSPTPIPPVPTAWPTPVPTSQGTKTPLSVDAQSVVVLHLKVDTGIPQSSSPVMKFDDYFQISDPDTLGGGDLTGIKMLVYVTDYYGNSAVYPFEKVQGVVYFSGFVFTANGVPQSVSGLEFFNIFVDSSATAQISWGGKSASCGTVEEQGSSTVMKATAQSKTVTITITNHDVVRKDTLLLY